MPDPHKKVAVVGSNLCNLIFMLENQAQPVCDISYFGDPELPTGHFSGLRIAEIDAVVDLGMVLFEFESYRQMAKLDVADYQLETPCDSGRFSARLEAYFNELGFSFVVTAPLLSWYQGELQPDVVIANHLDLLEHMPSGVRVQVKNELRQLAERAEDPLPPRRKTLWSTDRPVNLAAALRSSSGPTLSEHLWLPYCRNFGVDDASQIDGRLHRSIWLPLFYPESLLEYLESGRQNFAPSCFHRPEGMNTAQLIRQLSGRVQLDALAEVNPLDAEHPIDPQRLQKFDFVLFGASASLLPMPGFEPATPQDCCSIVLHYLEFTNPAPVDFHVINVLDPELCIYRLSRVFVSDEVELLCVEQRYTEDTDLASYQQLVGEELRRFGLYNGSPPVSPLKSIVAKDALNLPTIANAASSASEREALGRCHAGLHTTGANAPYGSRSFNDQCIHALQLFQLIGGNHAR